MSRGTLHIVGTPIGNLDDITLRAAETLRRAKRIAAEDTRRTRTLLSHLGIRGTPLHTLDAHASERAIVSLVDYLVAGDDIAVVTDAGMPSVSDPGAALVQAATAADIEVVVVPGPSAVTSAAALSGLVEAAFLFLGFLPRKGQKRRDALTRIANTVEPVLLFEAPNRTKETLTDLAALMPERAGAVCREMTKLHEETARGSLNKLAQREEWRGEVVIVVGPNASATVSCAPEPEDQESEVLKRLAAGETVRDIAGQLAPLWNLPRREVYALAQRLKGGSG